MVTKGGDIRSVTIAVSNSEFEGRRITQGIFIDVTERRRMEEALRDARAQSERQVEERTAELRQEQRRLSGIIAAADDGTWEWNVLTGETRYNERWAQIVGYTLEELAPVGRRAWVDLVHPEDFQRSEAALQRHCSGETDRYDCECRMRHKNGDWVWVLDRGRVVEWSPDRRPLRMFGTHTDITARKRM